MHLENFEIFFWDFDGVIKDSVSVKTDAFEEIFKPYGKKISSKIRDHHIENGGMSRFEKIPLYLKWANIEVNSNNIEEKCSQFSEIIKNKVINSKWVPGVIEFLENTKSKNSIIVSATPQNELEDICISLDLNKYFSSIYGSPISKFKAIKKSIDIHRVNPDKCLMFGDARTDIEAAKDNNIKFIFRRHDHNKFLDISSDIQVINDFTNINNLFKGM